MLDTFRRPIPMERELRLNRATADEQSEVK
jgi:hypothetical protein